MSRAPRTRCLPTRAPRAPKPPPPPTPLERLTALEARVAALEADGAAAVLKEVSNAVTRIEAQGKAILMAISNAERAIIGAFDTELNTISDRLTELRDNPPADDVEFNAELTALIERARILGQDPNNPIPPVEE